MRHTLRFSLLTLAILVAACSGLTAGRDFPSPSADMIRVGQSTQADMLKQFGEPTEKGLDTGDVTWTWLYARITQIEARKQLTVRFDDRGGVKSYSFTSSLPEDMKRLK